VIGNNSILGIAERKDRSVLVVAEVSANHNRQFDLAVRLIETAKECGADAVKFQAYTPDTLTINRIVLTRQKPSRV